eukprot:scaffold59246_cov62-Attheya_sp.AAC.5
MEHKGIDAYPIQEIWLPNNITSVINGHYMFHHSTEASDSNGGEGEQPPTPITARKKKKGHIKGGVALFLSPKATAAWKRAGQHAPTMSGNILGCARFISIPLHFTDHLGEIIEVLASTIQQDVIQTRLSARNKGSIYCQNDGTSVGHGVNEDDDKINHIGPHGLDHLNEAGLDLSNLL